MRMVAKLVRKLAGDGAHIFLRDLRDNIKYQWRCQVIKPRLIWLGMRARMSRHFGTTGNKCNNGIIVSLTSYPGRMNIRGVVEGAILSLLNQNVKPDRLILWLARDDFPNGINDVRKEIALLQRCGLEIFFCEEMRSYKKLIPTLSNWPDAIVITADDDVYYPSNWLEGLLSAHRENPLDVIAYIGRRINLAANAFAPYVSWMRNNFSGCSVLNLQTGVGGVVYPPKSWDKRILDYSIAKRLAPSNDDLPFHLFCVLKGSKIRAIKMRSKIIDLIPDMDVAPHLCSENVGGSKNDIYMENIAKEYPEYLKMLLFENEKQ